MSNQKVLSAVVVIVIIIGLLWYAGVIPSAWGGASQSAASIYGPAQRNPSTTGAVTAAQKASTQLSLAGKNNAKVAAAGPVVATAVAQLATLLPQLQASVSLSATKGNNMGAATAALIDYATRLSFLNSVPVTTENAQAIQTNLNAVVGDISTVNTELGAAKYR